MINQDFEDAHYWHVLVDVANLIRQYGYDNVMDNLELLIATNYEKSDLQK